MRPVARLLSILTAGLSLLACDTGQGPAHTVASVAVTPPTASLDALGQTLQLTAHATDTRGKAIQCGSLAWSSSAQSVATVSASGLVTAVANGMATITATCDGMSGTAAVTVAQTVAAVTVTPATVSFGAVGETAQLAAVAHDANGHAVAGVTLEWASSDVDCVTVSASGLVTAVASGSATITATAQGTGGQAVVTVAQVATAVTVTPTTASLHALAQTVQLAAVAQDANGHTIPGKTFTWTSSQETVATVSASGLVTAVANGAATISATADGLGASANVTVAQQLATVAVTPSASSLDALGATVQLTAEAQDANGHAIHGKTFTWTSSHEAIASVSASGLVTALANGTAVITATTGGVQGSASVNIAQKASSIGVSPEGVSVSGVGSTHQFTVEARDAGGSPILGPWIDATWTSLNPNVATVDPSTGRATAVESGQVTIAATANGMTAYGLLTVAVPGAEPVNLWSEMCNDCCAQAVWGSSASDIFATGGDLFLHYDGTGWSTMGTHAPAQGLGVWGTSATDVYAAYSDGIQHYDGTSWSTAISTTTVLNGVWGTSPTDIYAVGNAGTILHYDGTTWSTMASGTFGDLYDVWGTSATNVFAVGDLDRILHYDGTSWTATYETDMGLRGLWGTASNDVFAAGNGAVLRYDGTTWSEMPHDMYMPLEAVWGTSNTDVYAVGAWGSIFHYDGSSWSEMESGIGEYIMGVWGMSATDVYTVQRLGVILRGVRGASVIVTPSAHSLTAVGATVQLAAEARDADDNAISGVRFAWRSSNLSVATVDATGLVTAVGGGTAMITATVLGGASATATVSVAPGAGTTATITSPSNQATFAPGATVTFTGSGADPEGGTLTGASLVWTSSLDGQIGTGTSFTRNDLSVGTHTITLTATDSEGATGVATVTIHVSVLTPIAPGDWHGSTTGMALDFTVSANADYVTQLTYTFSGLTCGGHTLVSGGATVTKGSGWSITNGQFLVAPPGDNLPDIAGTFGDNGTTVTGTWTWYSCSGTWTGSH